MRRDNRSRGGGGGRDGGRDGGRGNGRGGSRSGGGRGRGGSGRGRGGRGYGRGGGHGRGGGRGRRGGYHGKGRGRHSSNSGNQRERIQVESGFLVLIDQFMLANPQFLDNLRENIDADFEVKNALIRDYGGTVVEVEPNVYRIERDPYAFNIVIHQDGDRPDVKDLMDNASDNVGHVFIDTRCLAMFDRELLDDTDLLEKYKGLWFGGQDKACRDLLRDNGGAVRYGFRRHGDELGVYNVGENIVALWPDISESTESDGEPQGEGSEGGESSSDEDSSSEPAQEAAVV